jgi:D-alanyl-lipoteichoic acid acyltransferase DltB (MBOAT superfamily)
VGRALRVGVTFAFVMFGWVFFAADLPTAIRIFARLFGVG